MVRSATRGQHESREYWHLLYEYQFAQFAHDENRRLIWRSYTRRVNFAGTLARQKEPVIVAVTRYTRKRQNGELERWTRIRRATGRCHAVYLARSSARTRWPPRKGSRVEKIRSSAVAAVATARHLLLKPIVRAAVKKFSRIRDIMALEFSPPPSPKDG